jgi:hypothetical protein
VLTFRYAPWHNAFFAAGKVALALSCAHLSTVSFIDTKGVGNYNNIVNKQYDLSYSQSSLSIILVINLRKRGELNTLKNQKFTKLKRES